MKVLGSDTITLLYGNDYVDLIAGRRNLALGTSENYNEAFTKFTGKGGDKATPSMKFTLPEDTKVGDKFTISATVKMENIVRNTEYASDSKLYLQIDGASTQHTDTVFTFTGTDPVSKEEEIVKTLSVSQSQLNDGTLTVSFRFDGISSGSFQWKKFKIEKGSGATKWTQAPEDIDNEFNDVKARLVSAETSIENNSTQISLKASQTTVDVINNNLEVYKTQTTSLIQDINGWQFNWDKVLNANNADVENHTDYITFDTGDIILGESDSDLKVKISNDMIQFKGTSANEVDPDDDATAWITGQTFNINTGEVHSKMIVGKLQLSPRSNGNLSISLVNK